MAARSRCHAIVRARRRLVSCWPRPEVRTAGFSSLPPAQRLRSMFDLTFVIDAQGTTTPLTLAIDQAVIAGWTGRDPVARNKHIAELEALGIARPATTTIYYRCSARRLR